MTSKGVLLSYNPAAMVDFANKGCIDCAHWLTTQSDISGNISFSTFACTIRAQYLKKNRRYHAQK